MKTHCANFDGDWSETCKFCGKSQLEHQHHLGDLEGVRYISRMPCEQEQHHIRKEAVKRGIILRTIILVYDTVQYLWGLIPFKEEIKLAWSYIKNIFISIRALIYLKKNKPK